MIARELAQQIVGLDMGLARYAIKVLGFVPRVSSYEGSSYILTMDYRLDRINLHIKNGMVERASIG